VRTNLAGQRRLHKRGCEPHGQDDETTDNETTGPQGLSLCSCSPSSRRPELHCRIHVTIMAQVGNAGLLAANTKGGLGAILCKRLTRTRGRLRVEG